MQNEKRKRIMAIFCIFIILAYTSILFFSYAHDCVGFNCAVCALIETTRTTIIALMVAATGHQLANITLAASYSYKSMPSGNDATPVTLKVKLSD